jgi:hypothetical protein
MIGHRPQPVTKPRTHLGPKREKTRVKRTAFPNGPNFLPKDGNRSVPKTSECVFCTRDDEMKDLCVVTERDYRRVCGYTASNDEWMTAG